MDFPGQGGGLTPLRSAGSRYDARTPRRIVMVETAKDLLAALKKEGSASCAAIYRKHGVTEETYGVSYAALGSLGKKRKVDPRVADELWRSGVHDARVLATRIVDHAALSATAIDRWIRDATNYIACDAVAALAARRDDALVIARGWIDDAGEYVAAAGWNVLGVLALEGKVGAAEGRRLLARIEKRIHAAQNRVRYAMNGALIGIGAGIEAVQDEAIAAAERIGKVEVDHGQTGCKTPDAAPYIEKVVAHRKSKGPRAAGAGKKTAAKKPSAASRGRGG
jgi:3-methyladenine DNA glycosylase AlkD